MPPPNVERVDHFPDLSLLDLPAPFGPTTPNTSPRSTPNVTARLCLNATGVGRRGLVNFDAGDPADVGVFTTSNDADRAPGVT
jgi:hypothetical protein